MSDLEQGENATDRPDQADAPDQGQEAPDKVTETETQTTERVEESGK